MNKLWVAPAALLALSGSLLADSVMSGTGSFSAFPSGFGASTSSLVNFAALPGAEGTPFWNNPSYDKGVGGSNMMNVGYLLTDSGGFAGTPSVLGTDSVSQDFTADGGPMPPDFAFMSSATAYNIALLFADSSLDTGNATYGTTFGYYVGDTFTPLYTPLNTSSPTGVTPFDPTGAGDSYGFYATVCYGGNDCETYTTGDGNSGNARGAAGWSHFALFELASGGYAIAFEDANRLYDEGFGDFNDVVVELQVKNASPVPEPATIPIMGMGLGGLAMAAYFVRKGTRGRGSSC